MRCPKVLSVKKRDWLYVLCCFKTQGGGMLKKKKKRGVLKFLKVGKEQKAGRNKGGKLVRGEGETI